MHLFTVQIVPTSNYLNDIVFC